MKLQYVILILCFTSANMAAQDQTLPYYEIPAAPDGFTAGTVVARMIDGLGFRYYWATEGLRNEDLIVKPGKDARSTEETLQHIYDLSVIIVNSTTKTPNVRGGNKTKLTFPEMRKLTLGNLKAASDKLRSSTDSDLYDYKIIFKREASVTEHPFWNQINGPISDALWHVGQVVSFRRSSGNPFPNKANVFTGKVTQ